MDITTPIFMKLALSVPLFVNNSYTEFPDNPTLMPVTDKWTDVVTT
jgi:hypothetical protein